MSLRINLYGCNVERFLEVLGSKDKSLIETAENILAESLTDNETRGKACAWLHTLINEGWILREERELPCVLDDGGLLVMRLETELHAIVVYGIFRALFRENCLDLSSESSDWKYAAVDLLSTELSRCGFMTSKGNSRQILGWLDALSQGTPFFGDNFYSGWSYYTVFTNAELADFVSVLQAAQQFEKPMPDDVPEEIREFNVTKLSDGCSKFARDLESWFSSIQQAGQDAFIMWW